MDVVVTGSEGFLGSATTACLRGAGLRVLGIDVRAEPRLGDADYRAVDIRDSRTLTGLLREIRPRVVVHLAAAMDVAGMNPADIVRTNIEGASNVLGAALAAGSKRFVYGSSVMVYGPQVGSIPVTESSPTAPRTLYGAAKVFVESLAQESYYTSDIETVGLRLTTVYGPGRARRGACPFVVDGFRSAALGTPADINIDQRTDIIFVEDAADAVLKAVENPSPLGGVFNIADQTVSGRDLIRVVRSIRPNARLREARGNESSWPHLVSTQRARDELGWRPQTSLTAGAEASIAWFERANKATHVDPSQQRSQK